MNENSGTPATEQLVRFEISTYAPIPPRNLPETDGMPMDSPWHRLAMTLLLEAVWYFFRDRTDFYAGGNMFLYFSAEQARNRDYRGPDFFFAWGVERDRERQYWAIWDEGGRYPNVIIELLSPSTVEEDRTTKRLLYENTFRTSEYYCYDPSTERFEGWRLKDSHYQSLEPDERGWLWSEQLGMGLGTWTGKYQELRTTWPRFYDAAGQLVPTRGEAAEQDAQNAHRRAEAAEAEVERLRRELDRRNGPSAAS